MEGNSFGPDDEKRFCCYCGRWLVGPLKYNTEHLVPKSKGGNSSASNKRLCCVKCNSWRNNKSLDEWRAEILVLIRYSRKRPGYNHEDLKAILENIEYWKQYIETSGQKLYRSNYIIKL